MSLFGPKMVETKKEFQRSKVVQMDPKGRPACFLLRKTSLGQFRPFWAIFDKK